MKVGASAGIEFRYDLDWCERAFRQDQDVNMQVSYEYGDLVNWRASARVPEQNVQLNTLTAMDCRSRRVESIL
jgi:hypothetical protein